MRTLCLLALVLCATGLATCQEVTAHGGKNPTTAAVMSALLPGSGQMYSGRYARGGAIMSGELLLVGMIGIAGFGSEMAADDQHSGDSTTNFVALTLLGIHVWQVSDAYKCAKQTRGGQALQSPGLSSSGLILSVDAQNRSVTIGHSFSF
jgi:hypothetical protein